jgi:subfamily B ATP-binding cassette protein MsbA
MIKRLFPYFKEHTVALVGALVAMVFSAPIPAAGMWIFKEAVNGVLQDKDIEMLKGIVLLVLILYFAKAFLTYVYDFLSAYLGQSIVKKIRDQAYAHLHDLSMDFFSKTDSARVISRLTIDAQLLQNGLTKIPIILVKDGLSVLALAALLFYLHWKFALLVLFLLPTAGGLIARFGKSLRKTSRACQEKMADLYARIQETVAGQAVVKAFLREDHEGERFVRLNEEYLHICLKNARVESLSSPVMELLGAISIAGLLWFGGCEVITGFWSAGDFLAFIGSALSLYQPVKSFSRSNATLQQALSGAERIFELMDAQPTVPQVSGAEILPDFEDGIHIEQVHFSYQKDRPVLRDIDLSIKKGEWVALVGPSGSGKTTLASLLLRFYDPTEGTVRVDGRDIRKITFHSLRRQIGLVTQETVLFNDTVRSNLAYGKPEATNDEIIRAAHTANAWEFVERLPQGLDTVVGERGVLLSGGQKQRLAIARALLKNPPILVMDEATSALDAQSEKWVQEAMERLMHNRTALVIAHRLATIKKATRIVVLDHGRVVQMGTHGELVDRPGLYRTLYELQLLETP